MPSAEAQPGKVLRVGILSPIPTLNLRDARDLVSTLVLGQIFETPYVPPPSDGPAQPVLFDGPLNREYAREGRTAVYATVRSGVTFSDGTPLTARHVADSLSRVEALKGRVSVEARGEQVLFNLSRPNPRFDLTLTFMHCGVVLESGTRLLGTGPYLPAPDATRTSMRLLANPRHRRRVGIGEIVFPVYPPDRDGHPTALIEALESGQVDFTSMLSRTDAAGIAGVKKSIQPSAATAMLYFNSERPALSSPALRRGLAVAIDRVALAEVSYSNPLAFAATSPIPPAMGVAHDDLAHDPSKARAILAQPGVVKPGRLRMLVVWAPRPYLPNPQPVAELIVKQLGALGIEVQIVIPATGEEYLRACERGDYDMVLGGWIADTPDPADFLEANLASDRVQIPGGTGADCHNVARLRSPRMDVALARFRETPSPEARSEILRVLGEEAPLVPLMFGPTVVVHSWRVKNVDVSPMGFPNFASFTLED
jgi:ABC-type transport system substrate-binding protein